ncbi:MAG: homoserine O-acetyltransferase [Pseudomonadota bacterium]
MAAEITQLPNGSYRFVDDTPFRFEGGGIFEPLELVFESYGELNAGRDNAVLVHHALSTDSHLTSTELNPQKGWWEDMVGPGCALDTDRYFIVCVNNLGSCFGSSGPFSRNPVNSERYRTRFPRISISDMVRSQKRLIDTLGIERLHTVLGNSMGAMLSLDWVVQYPQSTERVISISSCAQSFPANNANRYLQRDMIQLDPAWQGGYYDNSAELDGFRAARRLGLLTYRNWAELNERFVNKTGKDSIDHYLDYNADKFVRRFDCNSYLYLIDAMNTFNLADADGAFDAAFTPIEARAMVVSVDSDILFTPGQQRDLYRALEQAGVEVSFIEHHSTYGHDAFLVETAIFGEYIRDFLSR